MKNKLLALWVTVTMVLIPGSGIAASRVKSDSSVSKSIVKQTQETKAKSDGVEASKLGPATHWELQWEDLTPGRPKMHFVHLKKRLVKISAEKGSVIIETHPCKNLTQAQSQLKKDLKASRGLYESRGSLSLETGIHLTVQPPRTGDELKTREQLWKIVEAVLVSLEFLSKEESLRKAVARFAVHQLTRIAGVGWNPKLQQGDVWVPTLDFGRDAFTLIPSKALETGIQSLEIHGTKCSVISPAGLKDPVRRVQDQFLKWRMSKELTQVCGQPLFEGRFTNAKRENFYFFEKKCQIDFKLSDLLSEKPVFEGKGETVFWRGVREVLKIVSDRPQEQSEVLFDDGIAEELFRKAVTSFEDTLTQGNEHRLSCPVLPPVAGIIGVAVERYETTLMMVIQTKNNRTGKKFNGLQGLKCLKAPFWDSRKSLVLPMVTDAKNHFSVASQWIDVFKKELPEFTFWDDFRKELEKFVRESDQLQSGVPGLVREVVLRGDSSELDGPSVESKTKADTNPNTNTKTKAKTELAVESKSDSPQSKQEKKPCVVCKKETTQKCSCRLVHYCSQECQQGDRKRHKKECKAAMAAAAARVADAGNDASGSSSSTAAGEDVIADAGSDAADGTDAGNDAVSSSTAAAGDDVTADVGNEVD